MMLLHSVLQLLMVLLLQQVLQHWVLLLGTPALTVLRGWRLAMMKQLLSSLGFGTAAVQLLAFLGPLGSPAAAC